MKKKIVLLQGAFELINYGHARAFNRAKSEGDYLIIALNTDQLLKKYKNRIAVLPYWQKKVILEAMRCVDKVVPVRTFSPIELLKKYDVDVYCYTKEWEETKAIELKFMKDKGGRSVVLPRYKHVIPTSGIKKALLDEYLENLKEPSQ